MSGKSSKVYPSNDLDEMIKPAERRRRNSNGSAASPRQENSSKPPIVKMGRQNSFTGLPNKDRENNTPRGGSNNNSAHASPRPARSYAEGESLTRTRSNSISVKADPKATSLRRNNSFKFRKKRVTFRNPLTEFEPGWGYFGDADNTPSTADADLSTTLMQLDEDLRRRQENRRKRREERTTYNVNNVSCLGLVADGCATMLPSCTIS
jgi:hypothetical protein